jgi:hypothetical protein
MTMEGPLTSFTTTGVMPLSMRFKKWSKYRHFRPFIVVFDGYVGKYYVT